MRTVVGTLMWGTAWESYGRTFLETFLRFWPEEIGLMLVCDDTVPGFEVVDIPGARERVQRIALDSSIRLVQAKAKAAEFRGVIEERQHRGKPWKFDYAKWAPQGVAPAMMLDRLAHGDTFCWLDADVETLRPIPHAFVEGMLGTDDLIYLGRRKHSEIGFWACRVWPLAREFAAMMALYYASGSVLALHEWHSAFVFDEVRGALPGLRARSISREDGDQSHIWFASPLGAFMDHKKGKRKVGGSPEAARLRG